MQKAQPPGVYLTFAQAAFSERIAQAALFAFGRSR
jgi:hypothetical protein